MLKSSVPHGPRQRPRACFPAGLALAAIVPSLACAQPFWFGVRIGVPLTEYFQTGTVTFRPIGSSETYSAATRRYTLGVSAEWRRWQRLGFEADALYKRMGFRDVTRFTVYLTK